MNKNPSKEDGITLIELLATLAILSLVIVITYSVFFNGLNYSKKANDAVALQQEMNITIESITKFHESQSAYDIKVDQSPFASKITLIGSNTLVISNDQYEYSLYDFSGGTENLITDNKHINTSTEKLFIKMIIRNKKNPDEKYELRTVISRL